MFPPRSSSASSATISCRAMASLLVFTKPHQWHSSIAEVRFNSVLLNLYRDGKDGISWHTDAESELGNNPVIGSASFGGARRFMFKHKHNKDLKAEVELTHGSFLLMAGTTQHFWQHQIPKTSKKVNPRINLTFRVIGHS